MRRESSRDTHYYLQGICPGPYRLPGRGQPALRASADLHPPRPDPLHIHHLPLSGPGPTGRRIHLPRQEVYILHSIRYSFKIFYMILALKKGWLFVQVLCLLYCIVTSTVYLVALPAFWIIFCNLLDNNMKSTTLIGNDKNLNISEYLLMGWSESHLTLKCQWHRTFTPLYRQIFTDI